MNPPFPYSTHPSFDYMDAMAANLQANTGASLQEWVQRLSRLSATSKSERMAWLRSQGLNLNYASVIQEVADGFGTRESYDPQSLVDAIFVGPKAEFLPLYEAILRFSQTLGDAVKVCPCKTIIPFYREHVFAQVKVPNRKQLHLGLALGDHKAEGSLIDTGGYARKDRITHRLELNSESDFNEEARRWLHVAYDRDSPSVK